MTVIAMTREMATLGKDVAAGLAERLGLDIVHHELVEHDIAERSGLDESEVHRFLEGEASLWERWRIDRQRLSRYTIQEILELAAKGNVLIRGWGASYLLSAVPHIVCVRVCASMLFRTRVLMQRMGMTNLAVAQREIDRSDAAHHDTLQRLFGVDWQDAALYALTLNTARIPVADCVDQIARLAESDAFRETPESRAMLMDKLIESRARSRLGEHFTSGIDGVAFDLSVKDSTLTLSGAIRDRGVIAEIEQQARGIEGVQRVDSRLRHVVLSRSAV